ncbi:tRNA (cytosine(34)-C(5))-methyltransferase-like, partial [Phlebotomus argentipes]|uniref:tRNA (cytosine(34)-C(5))-methyltransferase-like n=1 Tax=Phlebotomus argentipes TaxID=94469 RepID=UPI00289355D5
RILCDVPCSGDATLRKNPDIWTKWNPAHDTNLNGVQFRIAKRGAELLTIGGRLVYSTCSFNPVENEAVILRLLKESEGALDLIDASSLVPGLKFSLGMQKWELAAKDMSFYADFQAVPEQYHIILRPQMFPPEDSLWRCW